MTVHQRNSSETDANRLSESREKKESSVQAIGYEELRIAENIGKTSENLTGELRHIQRIRRGSRTACMRLWLHFECIRKTASQN